MEKFRKYLKENGLKVTPERLAAARVAFTFKSQFTIRDLQSKVLELGWPISRPTLYRTLSILEDAQFIKTVYCSKSGQKQFATSLHRSSSITMLCMHCEKTVNIESHYFTEICENLCSSYDFNAISALDFTLEGCCSGCSQESATDIELQVKVHDVKSPVRVIVFDDDVAVLELLSEFLIDNDYEVHSYSDPSEWRCCSSEEDFCPIGVDETCTDIIITDIRMPNITGVELIRSLEKKHCKVQNVAFMTGAAECDQLEFVKEHGYKLFRKPFDLTDIEAWIESCR